MLIEIRDIKQHFVFILNYSNCKVNLYKYRLHISMWLIKPPSKAAQSIVNIPYMGLPNPLNLQHFLALHLSLLLNFP